MNQTLTDRVAIVTGAGQGIGKAIATRLAAEGARVAILDNRAEAATQAAAEIGSDCIGLQADVTSESEINEAVDAVVQRWGSMDILVNNAGIVGRDVPVVELTEADWDSVLDINLKGVFLCCRAVLPHMIRRNSGSIVSIASVAGKEGNPSMAAYSVSKAGIICFTKSLAKEVVTQGIRVNCVSPALIQTSLTDGMDQTQIDYMTSRIPMGRLGKPEEVAAVVHFLVSDEASFATGQCYDVSGGRSNY